MAEIVIGVGTSHSPLLTIPANEWTLRAQADYQNKALNFSDGRLVSYEQLLAERGSIYEQNAQPEVLEAQARRAQTSLDRIADDLEQANPDVVIIVGDDQDELYGSSNQPAISIYHGERLVMNDKYGRSEYPAWMNRMAKGYLMDKNHSHPCQSEFGLALVERLIDSDVDIGSAASIEDPKIRGFGHAFGFIIERLFKGKEYPVIPLLLNTYFPPNVISSSRAYDIGRKTRAVIESMPVDTRVAIIASGGLSHFITDAELDEGVLNAMTNHDEQFLKSIARGALKSGSSEILNWVLTAGAITHLNCSWSKYEPVYRTPAAFPVRCPAGDNLFIHKALAEAGKDDVLVVDCGSEGNDFGYWGEIMTTAALAREIAGLVITGGIRDSVRIIELGHPTFSGAVTVQGTGKNAELDGAVGETIRIGEVVIRRGDLVLGDADGVVSVAQSKADAVVQLSEERDAKEVGVMEQLRAGALTIDVYNF